MKILLTGPTGLIGCELGKALVFSGHEIVALTRDPDSAKSKLPFPAKIFAWDGLSAPAKECLDGVEAVIHLSGESIGEKRWSQEQKKKIIDSRVLSTQCLVQAIRGRYEQGQGTVKQFICASGIGYYGDLGKNSNQLDEQSQAGNDFLAKVCLDWEKAAHDLRSLKIAVTHVRTGVVLARHGGALSKLIPLFSNNLGAVMGSGEQWMSWIHLEDITRLYVWALQNKMDGVINGVAPHPVTNHEFSNKLSKKFGTILMPAVPGIVLKASLGEMATLILGGQRAIPKRVLDAGFTFHYSDLDLAFDELLSPLLENQYELLEEQWVSKKPEDVFSYFCDEKNLEELTPSFLNFKVLGKSTSQIGEGTLIDYRLKLHGVPISWKTRIESWKPGISFIDNQLKGPYKKWHHTHEFVPMAGGTLLRDRVIYSLPFGCIGRIAASHKVQSDVQKIFKFRRRIIAKKFYK